jgi:hypothetical protein
MVGRCPVRTSTVPFSRDERRQVRGLRPVPRRARPTRAQPHVRFDHQPGRVEVLGAAAQFGNRGGFGGVIWDRFTGVSLVLPFAVEFGAIVTTS